MIKRKEYKTQRGNFILDLLPKYNNEYNFILHYSVKNINHLLLVLFHV